MRIAWEGNLVDAETWIAIKEEPNEKPLQQRPLPWTLVHELDRDCFRALKARAVNQSEHCYITGTDSIGTASGAITVRHDERQVYATNGGKEAIDAWIERRGDWPGALLCPIAKGGRNPAGGT